MKKYDCIVIGSGPGGQKAAIQAAKLGKKTAVIERSPFVGGAGIHTGTLPSKTLRETALFIAGLRQRAVFGFHAVVGKDVTLSELMHRTSEVVRKQTDVILDQFTRNNVEIIYGIASIKGPGTVSVRSASGAQEDVSSGVIIIATGSRPAHPEGLMFNSGQVYDSDTILTLDRIPETLTVVGGGVIGCEYACIFAALGVKVTLVEKKARLLDFADEEIVASLMYWMRHSGVTLRLGETVVDMAVEGPGRVVTRLESGKVIATQKLLYTMGRVGNTDGLGLEALGIEVSQRGLVKVDGSFRTSVGSIYAIGDVIGFPSLASSSMEQGRRAVCNAFSMEGLTCDIPGHLPYGVYTIPEISMVGATEQSLTEKGVAYEVGCAYFNEVARGQIIGDQHGMVKLIFERATRKLLGVHIVGERASELIHIGQAVLNYGGPVDYFKDAVFNYPTLTDAYKEAALNGLNKL